MAKDKQVLVEDFITQIVSATFKLLEARCEDKKLDKAIVFTSFLGQFLGTLVYRGLTAKLPDGLSKEQQYAKIQKNFNSLKFLIQESIAAAFTAAMSKYSRHEVEYYTKILTVPERLANKKDA